MVKFILLNPDGDCQDANIPLKGKDNQKTLEQIMKKKVDNPDYNEAEKTPKKVGLVELQIKNKGEVSVKLTEIAQWKLNSEFKLVGYGYAENTKKKKSTKAATQSPPPSINNHELPPCKNGAQKYYGDILVFKINDKSQLLDYTSDEYSVDYQEMFFKDELSDSEDDEDGDPFGEDDIDGEGEPNFDEDEEEEIDDVEMYKGGEDENDDTDGMDYGEEEGEDDEELDELEEGEEEDELGETTTIKKKAASKSKTDVSVEVETGAQLEVHTLPNDDDDLVDENDEEVKQLVEPREKMIEIFTNLLKDKKLSQRVEESIFKNVFELAKERRVLRKWDNPIFKKMYVNKARSIYTNLKSDSYVKNVKLAQNIKKKKFDIDNIGEMSYQELYPEHWKKLLDEKFKREKVMYEEKEEAMTDQFKCGRCKSRKCTYYELQTRSADEGMTTFITCINCGNRWKQ